MKRSLTKTLSLLLLLAFSANTCCYALATLPASQNPIAKREIEAALQRTQIRYAESDDAIKLLNANNASCLLLSSGKYLVTKEVAENDLKLLRAIIHEDIEAVMQILAKEDRYKYQGMKELILKYFPPSKDNKLPIDLYANHTIAKAFEWLILIRQGIILRDEISEEARDFIKDVEPIINANKHNYFTVEFWDSSKRSSRIRQALSKGFVFYQTAGKSENLAAFYGDNAQTERSTGALGINFPEEISMFCSGKRIGITGASGVIGSSLVRRLIRENPEIKLNVLIRRTAKQRPAWDNLLKRFPQNINIIEGDLMEIEALRRLVKESDAIFHIALDSRDDFRSQEPGGDDRSREILISNTVPGAVMSSLAAEENKPFIFASSYGIFFHIMKSSKGQRLKEEDIFIGADLKKNVEDFVAVLQRSNPSLSNDEPASVETMLNKMRDHLRATKLFSNLSNHQLYAVQKLINEYIIKKYPHAIALRIGNIYGPGDAEGRPMPGLVKKAMAGDKQLIPNDRRSYIYVGDVAEALLRAAVVSQKGLLSESDRVISVAHPEVTDSLSVAKKIKDELSTKTEFEVQGDQMNENLELDLGRMRSILDMPSSKLFSLEGGIQRTIKPQQDDVRSAYDILRRDVDKNRILLLVLYADDFPFTGESAGVDAISGYMQHHHREVNIDVLDMQLDKIDDILNEIKMKKPAILGISVKLKTHNRLLELCKRIYEEIPSTQRPLIVIGNALPAYVGDLILKEQLSDVVIGLGEGEVSIEDIYLYAHGRMRLEDVRNIVYVDSNGAIQKNRVELMSPDRFAVPDRRRTVEFYKKGGIVYAEQSRGCPWGRCTICASSEVLGSHIEEKRWRPLPLEVVMEDLDILQKMDVEVVRYSDEEFLGRGRLGIERARKFAEEKIRRGNKVKFDIMARVDLIYDEKDSEEDRQARVEALRLLKEAGLIKISLEVESFSQAQLRRYAKGITTKEISEALRIVRDLKIPLGIGFIPCDPLISLAELEETLKGLITAGALMESSVTFNELRVQEGSGYLHLARHKEKETGIKMLGPLDMNSLNYPVIRYLDNRVGMYVKALRDLYTRKQLYRIIYYLRIYTQYSSYKHAIADAGLPNNVSAESAYNLLVRIRQLDYQLSMELIQELKISNPNESTKKKINGIVQSFDERIEKEIVPFLVELRKANKSELFGKNRQIDELVAAMTEYVIPTHSLSNLQLKDLDEARTWIKNEFVPMQNLYRQLKLGRKLAEEHLRAFTAITGIILNQTGLEGKVSIMTYGSAAGKFMTENADTDFCILSDGTVSDVDILRLQAEIEKGLRSVPGYPWKVSFKSWELVKINMMDLMCARFVCGNKGIYDRHITHNPHVLQIVNHRDNLIAAITRSDLYIDFISSPAFSQRLRRFLTQEEFPEDIKYGNVKFYRGGLRTAQAIIHMALLYSDNGGQFLEDADISPLVKAGIISAEDAQKFYRAVDFLLTVKDTVVYGYNMFNKKNIEKLSTVLGEDENSIKEQYDTIAGDLTYILDKVRRAIQQANGSNMSVRARLSKDKSELKQITDNDSVDLWMTLGLRHDLPVGTREYLEKKIRDKQRIAPSSFLDEMEEGLRWAKDVQEGAIQDIAGKRDVVDVKIIENVKSAFGSFKINKNDVSSSLRLFISYNFSRIYETGDIKDIKKFRSIFARAVKDYVSIRLASVSGLPTIIEQACDDAETYVLNRAAVNVIMNETFSRILLPDKRSKAEEQKLVILFDVGKYTQEIQEEVMKKLPISIKGKISWKKPGNCYVSLAVFEPFQGNSFAEKIRRFGDLLDLIMPGRFKQFIFKAKGLAVFSKSAIVIPMYADHLTYTEMVRLRNAVVNNAKDGTVVDHDKNHVPHITLGYLTEKLTVEEHKILYDTIQSLKEHTWGNIPVDSASYAKVNFYSNREKDSVNGIKNYSFRAQAKRPIPTGLIPKNISFIELHLTNECNQKCAWCGYGEADKKRHLKFEDLNKIAELAPAEILIVGGGEPTLYGDGDKTFNDAIGRLRELLPTARLRLITNGTVIPPGDWQHKIDEVSISLDEATRESYLAHKKIDGFERAWSNIIDGYLVEGPIQSVRVTMIYNAERIDDGFLLAEKLWKEWNGLVNSHKISEEKAKNFKFMMFPMANDAIPDRPYEATVLTDPQRKKWQENLDMIRTKNLVFFTFLKEHTNLCTQHMKDLSVFPSEKCWSVSNYALVGADRVLYPCFAACEACRSINLGSLDQTPSEILGRRESLFNNPPPRCHQGCRPNATFYGLKSFNLLFERMPIEFREAEEALNSLKGDEYAKAFEYYHERVNIAIAMFKQRFSQAVDEEEKTRYLSEIDKLKDNLAKFERANLPKLVINVSFQDPDHLAGGQGWAVLNLCKAQIKQGFDVVWISPCIRDERPGEYFYLGGKLKVIKIRISDSPVLTLYANNEETQANRRIFGDKFVEYIKENYGSGDRTIHLHGFIEVPRRAAELKSCGYNVTSTFHMFLSPRIEATKTNEAFLARLREIEHEAIMANSKIIVNSVGMSEEVMSLCPDYKGSIFVVRNGVGDEYFNAPKAYKERGPPTISTYGRISPEKGFDIFIEAAKIVTEKRKSEGKEEVKFLVFGNNDDTIKARREYLADLKKRKKGFDNITIIARPEGIRGDEKWRYIDSSTIGVVPSLYEPFGMVIPEYMARGLPVITTLIPGAIDIFKSDKLGTTPFGIIADKTPESMANAMEWMLNHPEETKIMGENAGERAKDYKWSEVLRETMDVYKTKTAILPMEKEKAEYDASNATILLTDLLHAQLQNDRNYEIKYDASRLTTSQIEIIEEYARLLQLRSSNPDSIKLRPFSRTQGSKESLIAVYCTGKDFKGEGHVDVAIPEGELKDYLLRIAGMVNIALASSNIPDNLSREDVDKYRPIMSYIKNQYKAILGEELAIPDNPEDILKVIRRIVLGLPKSLRMNTDQIEEFNRLAKAALTAA